MGPAPPVATGPEHLIVLVHGLWGGQGDWEELAGVLRSGDLSGQLLVVVSTSNEHTRKQPLTFDGEQYAIS